MATSILTHILAGLFGMGSWVTICGLWVELPLIVPQVPEGWYLPSYISVIVQLANIGPLFVTLMHRFRPGMLNETAVIYFIVGFGILASLFLAFFWMDCTSSVTFLPFMTQLRAEYLMTYYVGEGLSGLVPALVALVQGVDSTYLVPHYQPANFSVEAYFFFLMAMMVVCLVAFILLNYHPAVARERPDNINGNGDPILRWKNKKSEQKPMMRSQKASQKPKSTFGTGTHTWIQVIYIYIMLAWVTALTNTGLPSVQSYSCLPYGDQAYHWSATMANIANPIACFISMFYTQRSLLLMGVLTSVGSLIGFYIMGMAVLSPCPLLVNDTSGAVIIVLAWFFFIFILSYVKVIVAVILRDEGHSALVWCGAVVQLGSMLGAVTMFPLVNIYDFFTSGDPCNTYCL
uniref:Riboflavin transporter n=1 Tax=Cyprinus carpio TaxID=7962 RepID=A0A8C2D7I6_CYPCA